MQCQKLKTYMETGRVVFLPARSILPGKYQPRQVFGGQALEELAESIRCHGILQPLSVRRAGGNRYELIAGERRLRAGMLAGLTEIPCIIMNMDEEESAAASLVENLQRQDLDFIEEARGIARLMEITGYNQEQTARILGKSQSALANKLRLLHHSPEVLNALRQGNLTERHGRALLKLSREEDKLEVIRHILEENMSVARAEQYIAQKLRGRRESPKGVEHLISRLSASLQKIQSSGVAAVSKRTETDAEIVLTITIPKSGFVNMSKKEGRNL